MTVQELAAEGDRSSLHDAARALLGLQSLFGCARILKGKGAAAHAVRTQLSRMRRELNPDELPLPGTSAPALVKARTYNACISVPASMRACQWVQTGSR